jgi:hypothetical protein
MNEIEKKIMRELGPEYDHSGKPTVYFFDFADKLPDGKYRNAVYISKISKTGLGTQDFRRRSTEKDRAEFPREWEHYLKVKENLKSPKVDLLPGIDQATLMEMKDKKLFNLEQLAEQNEFSQWADMARRILNAISENGNERRVCLQGNEAGIERVLGENRPGSGGNRTIQNTGGSSPFYFGPKEKGYPQASEVSWSFEVVQ